MRYDHWLEARQLAGFGWKTLRGLIFGSSQEGKVRHEGDCSSKLEAISYIYKFNIFRFLVYVIQDVKADGKFF